MGGKGVRLGDLCGEGGPTVEFSREFEEIHYEGSVQGRGRFKEKKEKISTRLILESGSLASYIPAPLHTNLIVLLQVAGLAGVNSRSWV